MAPVRAEPERWVWAVLAGLTLAAFVLRLNGLSAPLWYDEMEIVTRWLGGSLGDVVSLFGSNNNHPLYTVAAKISTDLLGQTPFAVRLPAVLFGTAAVPAVYVFARRFLDVRAALTAAFFVAVSYHAIWFSQNARGYTILMLMSIIGTGALYDAVALRAHPVRNMAIYALTIALASYTHLTMVLLAVGQALAVLGYILMSARRERVLPELGVALAGFVGAAALTLLFYAPMLGEVIGFFLQGSGSAATANNAAVASPGWAIAAAVREVTENYGGVGPAALVVALMLAGGVGLLIRQPFLTALVVLPVPVIVAATVGLGRPIFPRFFFGLGGFLIVAVAFGLWLVVDWLTATVASARSWIGGGLAAVVALSLGFGTLLTWGMPKQDFPGAVAAMEAAHPDLVSYAVAAPAALAVNDYLGKDWPVIASPAAFQAAQASGAPFQIVYTFRRYMVAGDEKLLGMIEAACENITTRPATVSGAEVYADLCQP